MLTMPTVRDVRDGDILNRRGKTNLICIYRGLIEVGPKKCPRQVAFILFRQRNNKLLRNCQSKET